MNLRWQLLLLCSTLLILPCLSWRFVAELDFDVYQNQIGSSERLGAGTSQALALLESRWRGLRARVESKTLLAPPLQSEILLDGYSHDWTGYDYPARNFRYRDNKIHYRSADAESASRFSLFAARQQDRLAVFLRVFDDKVIYHNPSSVRVATGDSVVLRMPDENGHIRRYTFRAEGDGLIVARYRGRQFEGVRPILKAPDYNAAFIQTRNGYNLEFSIPWPRDGEFGITVIDRDGGAVPGHWTGMFNPDEVDDTGYLRSFDPQFDRLISSRTEKGMRMRLFDAQGWLVADADQRRPDAEIRRIGSAADGFIDTILLRFIRTALDGDISAEMLPDFASGKLANRDIEDFAARAGNSSFMRDRYGRVFLVLVEKILAQNGDLVGYLLMQQPRVGMSALTEQSVLKLVRIFALAAACIALVLVGYASWLSWRIGRLRDRVEVTVNADGSTTAQLLPVSRARDEIGDLTRSFASIAARQRSYTDYLRQLGSRLSHELRTPLSVLNTSLESIDRESLDQHTSACLTRAGEGAERLKTLIRSLSEASSLEQTIGHAELVPLSLRKWLQAAHEVYTDTFGEQRFELKIDDAVAPALINGSAELLTQMLDKLIANACDFARPDTPVVLTLAGDASMPVLSVTNTGPPLPEELQSQIFQSMVSARQSRDDQPHMGLGLYIVRLVAEYHGAEVSAANKPDGCVSFRVVFTL